MSHRVRSSTVTSNLFHQQAQLAAEAPSRGNITVGSILEYETILLENDDQSRRQASQDPQDVKRETEFILGSTRDWSSENEEAILFRENMSNAVSFLKTVEELVQEQRIKEMSSPAPAKIICKVNWVELEITKAISISSDITPDGFVSYFIEKVALSKPSALKEKNWILKSSETEEYFFGRTRLVDYIYFQDCLANGNRPSLQLIDKALCTSTTNIYERQLGHICFDIGYQKSERSEFSSKFEHQNLDISKKLETSLVKDIEYFSSWDIQKHLQIKIFGFNMITVTDTLKASVEDLEESLLFCYVQVFFGGTTICKSKFSNFISFTTCPEFYQTIIFDDLLICNIPREAKISVTLYARPPIKNPKEPVPLYYNTVEEKQPKDYPIGYLCSQIFDFKGFFRGGRTSMRMWLGESGKPSSSCIENKGASLSMCFELPKFALPVVFPHGEIPQYQKDSYRAYEKEQRESSVYMIGEELIKELERLIEMDPLYEFTEEEKWRIWDNRCIVAYYPSGLSKFLLSVPWKFPYAVYIAHQMIEQWEEVNPMDCIELLDFNFNSTAVRNFAVMRMDSLSDAKLEDLLLQLIQTLKFELYHDSALARFLLQRALRSIKTIGNTVFWHLKSEMHVPSIKERYGLLLQQLLKHCGGYNRRLFIKQNGIVTQLLRTALKIKDAKKSDHIRVLHEELSKLKLPPVFNLPLKPEIQVTGLLIEKCKVMDSKKLPLWLVFANANVQHEPFKVIFKVGDDLRQDMLTLQLFRVCDNLWKENNLELEMNIYGCIGLGDEIGMIEVVSNADTIANITAAKGGAGAALSSAPLLSWLRKYNTTPEQINNATTQFAKSCAAYCTVTHVLGIGDRHNDNIMLTKSGQLFHIDFGHFLGNFKKFAGISRETSPFIFTPMYAYVLKGTESDEFKLFSNLGSQAFNILRKHAKLMMTLFLLMLSTGIPELQSAEDILWLRKCLVMEKSTEEASRHFQELIRLSLANTRAVLNDIVHILAHKK